jgi:homospermidine synthase
MMKFDGKILFVGYGAVAQCTLPILMKLMKVSPRNITVMDFEDKRKELKPWIAKGVTFIRKRVTQDNLDATAGKYLSAGDILIDLAWNIECGSLLQWCHDRGVLYLNTSTELEDPYTPARWTSTPPSAPSTGAT